MNLATLYTNKFNYSCHNRIYIYCAKNSTIVFGDKNVLKIRFVSNFLFTSLSIMYNSTKLFFWVNIFILFIYFSLTCKFQSQANGFFVSLEFLGAHCSHYLLCRLRKHHIIELKKKIITMIIYLLNNDNTNNHITIKYFELGKNLLQAII